MSCVGVRGTVLLLLAVLAGGAGGWAYAERTSGPVISGAAPGPVAADDPSIPYTPPEKTRPDSDLPPLTASVDMHDERLGTPRDGGIVLPVPDGWDRFTFSDDVQARWTAPGNPSGAYSVRVQVIDENRSISQKVAARDDELLADAGVSDLEVFTQSVDTFRAGFIFGGYRKLTVIRWVSLGDAGFADVEIAATGRLIDERGMDALVARIATEVRRQPPPAPAQLPGPDDAAAAQ